LLTRSEIKQRGTAKGHTQEAHQIEPSVPPMGGTGRWRRGWCRIVRRRRRGRVVRRRRRRVVRGRRRSVTRWRGTIMRSRHSSRRVRVRRTVTGIERIRTRLHLIRVRLHLILLGQVGWYPVLLHCWPIAGNALDVVVIRLCRMTGVRLLRMNHGRRLVPLSAKTSLAIEYRTNTRCRSSESGESLLAIANFGNRCDHASAHIHCVSPIFKRVTHYPRASRI
jgi:hypothetical protein